MRQFIAWWALAAFFMGIWIEKFIRFSDSPIMFAVGLFVVPGIGALGVVLLFSFLVHATEAAQEVTQYYRSLNQKEGGKK